jgi:hypothetical protein
MSSNIVRFDAVRSVPIASITGSYITLGTRLTHAMRVLHFINDTNGTYMVSFDGTTDNVPILADGFSLYDLTSDQDGNESFRYEIGTQLYIKSIVAPTTVSGTSNTFYVVAIFGKGE